MARYSVEYPLLEVSSPKKKYSSSLYLREREGGVFNNRHRRCTSFGMDLSKMVEIINKLWRNVTVFSFNTNIWSKCLYDRVSTCECINTSDQLDVCLFNFPAENNFNKKI